MCVSGKSKVRGDEPAAHRPQAFLATLKLIGIYYIYNFTMKFQSGKHAACFPVFNHRGFYFPPSSMVPLSLQRGKRAACFPLLHRQIRGMRLEGG